MLYHAHTASDVLRQLDTSEKGLHQIYAEARLGQYGRNDIRMTRQSLGRTLIDPFTSPFMWLLLVALGLSLVTMQQVTAGLIAATIVLHMAVRYAQRFSTEHVLRTLEHRATGDARIRRDGIRAHLNPSLLVPGDIVLLSAGDRVPADGRVLHSQQLKINQLQLTGEPSPVTKRPGTEHSQTALEARDNMVYRGTFVTSGSGSYVVTATGNTTEYGHLLEKIARTTRRANLQKKIDHLTRTLAVIVVAVAALLLIMDLARGMSLADAANYAIAIVVAAVPGILPLAIGLVVTLGLRHMARRHALVRTIQVVEAISMISTIAADKTGMLTRNQLTVTETWHPATNKKAFATIMQRSVVHTLGEYAALDKALAHAAQQSPGRQAAKPALSYEFDRKTLMSGNLWHNGAVYDLVLKGAPEKILHHSDLTENERETATHRLHDLTSRGLHVVAIARASLDTPLTRLAKLPKRHQLEFVGFVACQDQTRPGAAQAVALASQAGIDMRMVTGDHVETAYSLAAQLGITDTPDAVLDGRKLDVMSDSELARVARHIRVFARAAPAHKHRLLGALRRHHVVAMTGGNVDDIPALIQAHVGVTAASSSTLARDASDVILLDNNFSSLLEAIRGSRTILGNIRRMVLFLLTVTVAEVGIVLGSIILGMPPALSPTQLLWLNLVITASLVIPLGLEPHSRNIMKRRPVSPRAGILPRYLVVRLAALAATMIVVSLAVFGVVVQTESVTYAQTLVFYGFVVMQIVAAFSARSDHTSTLVRLRTFSGAFYIGIAITTILLLVSIAVFGSWLQLTPLGEHAFIQMTGLAIMAPLVVSELLKWQSRRQIRAHGRSYE